MNAVMVYLFAGKTVLSIPERIEDEVLTKWCYIYFLHLPLPLLKNLQFVFYTFPCSSSVE